MLIPPPKSGQLLYLDYFRGIAIIFIIAGHVLMPFYRGFSPYFREILGAVLVGGTILFVFIAGFLFQYLSDRFRYFDYMKKKVLNVVFPYLIATFLILSAQFLMGSKSGMSIAEIIKAYPEAILFGSAAPPLWFIPMIVFFYIISPFFVWFDRHNYYKYLIFLLCLSFFFSRGAFNGIGQNTIHFFPIYILGMYCSRYRDEMNKLFGGNVLFLLFIIFILYLFAELNTFRFFDHMGFSIHSSIKFDPDILKPVVFLTTAKIVSCFWWVQFFRYLEQKIQNTIFGSILRILAQYSFGLFFYHNSVIALVQKVAAKSGWGIYSNPSGAILFLLFLAEVIIVLFLTMLFLWLMRLGLKTLKIKRSRPFIGV